MINRNLMKLNKDKKMKRIVIKANILGSFKVCWYVPRNQLNQFRISGSLLHEGIAGNQEY